MLMPKKVKHRKQMKGRMTGKAIRGSSISFGEYGLKTLEPGWITDRQIEAARIAMTRHVKRGGKIWIRMFPDKPITKKPAETRMGKGKGAPDHWVAVERRVPHPVYGKMVTRTKRFKAHDEENSAKAGDTVRIMETRPLSKDKRWRVVEILERAR